MSSFWQGFEKQAFLKGVLKSDLFNKAVNAKYKNAIKNFKGEFSHQDSIVGAVKSLIKKPSMSNLLALTPGMTLRGGQIGVNTSMAHMVTEKGLNKLRSAPPTLGAQIVHHELNEAAEMSRKGYGEKGREMFTPGIRDLLSPLRAKRTRDAFRIAGKPPEYVAKLHGMYEKAPKFLQHPKVKHILGAAKEDSKSVHEILDAVAKTPQTRIALLGKVQTGAHASPSILINESNKLFHEADPRAIEAMKNVRKTTGEAELLRRSGIRYGEEYVPENGRRFNKAVGRIREENFK